MSAISPGAIATDLAAIRALVRTDEEIADAAKGITFPDSAGWTDTEKAAHIEGWIWGRKWERDRGFSDMTIQAVRTLLAHIAKQDARLAELEATVSAERGEGSGPTAGWRWTGDEWIKGVSVREVTVTLGGDGWTVHHRRTYDPGYRTAWHAMKAADSTHFQSFGHASAAPK